MTADVTAACCDCLAASEQSDAQAARIAALFKALGDPHRVRIVNVLATAAEPVCVCELTTALELAQPTVSHHLKKLVAVGLLHREQRGTWAYYSLEREAVRRLGRIIDVEGAGHEHR